MATNEMRVWNGTTHQLIDNIDNIAMHDHAFEKGFSYIIRKNGSYYEAIKGGGSTGAGMIAYGGSGNVGSATGTSFVSVLQKTIDACRGTVNHAVTGTAARVNAHTTIRIVGNHTVADGDIDIADTDGLTIEGDGGTITIQTNDSIVFDCTNSANLRFKNLIFDIAATYHPDVLFLLSRDNSGASAEFNKFVDCRFDDSSSAGMDVAFIYCHASELMKIENCWFKHDKNAVVVTSSNRSSITSVYKTITTGGAYSCRGVHFAHTAWTKTHWATVSPYYSIILEGAGESVVDGNCYFGTGGTNANYAFYIDLANDALYSMSVSDTKFEGKVVTCGGNAGAQTIMGLRFHNNYFYIEAGDAGNYIDLNKANTSAANFAFRDNIFHIGQTFKVLFPSSSACVYDFSNCWEEPEVTIADFYDSYLYMWHKNHCTFTTFNRGFVKFIVDGGGTYNSGTSVGTGAPQTIAHKLVGTPNRIWFGTWDNGVVCFVAAASDATNIYPQATLGANYIWCAELAYP